MEREQTAFFMIAGAVVFAVFVAQLVVSAVICYLISRWLGEVPREHRRMEPAMVWLLLIPCFNLFWNFVVFQKIPDSYKSYFDSVGRRDLGDCGRGIGLAFAITSAARIVPFVQYLAGIATVVLLILCLVKFHELTLHLRGR